MRLRLEDLHGTFGFGVAGNFAGHLEQAGEDADFVAVHCEDDEAPKGIFPWYVPGSTTFLGTFPLSHDRIVLPASEEPLNLQIEPEVAVVCAVRYAEDGTVVTLIPELLGAFNDCSIRRPGTPKISQKKNWSSESKGIAAECLAVDDLEDDGPTRTLRLTCFLRRDGQTHPYGVDSPLTGYSYYGSRLLEWMVDRLNHQRGAPDTPLEDVGAALAAAGRPPSVLVGIGATRYTELGATTFLTAGDESLVVVYDSKTCAADGVVDAVRRGDEDSLPGASLLRQTVVSA